MTPESGWQALAHGLLVGAGVLVSGYGWGQLVRRGLGHRLNAPPGWWTGLGLGALAWLLGGLGFVPKGWNGPAFFLVLAIGWLGLKYADRPRWRTWGPWAASQSRALPLLSGLIVLLAFLWGWVPPWAYDALMYHLQGPRLLLRAGHWYLEPNLWPLNGPFLGQMLYLAVLRLGTPLPAAPIHALFGGLVLLLLADWGYRLFGDARRAWWSVAWILGTPYYAIWMTWPYIDLIWIFFQVGSAYATWRAWQADASARWAWARLSAVSLGLALGAKLLALGWAVALAAFWLYRLARAGRRSQLLAWGGIVAALAAPWYLRSWWWTGNPVYPFFWGGPGWPARRVALFMAYLHSFGWGNGAWRYVLWPLGIYLHPERYRTIIIGRQEYPPLLAWLVWLWPWLPRERRRATAWPAAWALVNAGLWTLGTQQIRFLFPAFVLAALPLTAVLDALTARGRWLRQALTGLLLGLLSASLLYMLLIGLYLRPWSWWTGATSTAAWVSRLVPPYPLWQFARHQLPAGARVLPLWDGETYYCDPVCLPNGDHGRWTMLVLQFGPDSAAIAAQLRAQGITHLLYQPDRAAYFQAHDPSGAHARAWRFFSETFLPHCTRPVYASSGPWPGGLVALQPHCLPNEAKKQGP